MELQCKDITSSLLLYKFHANLKLIYYSKNFTTDFCNITSITKQDILINIIGKQSTVTHGTANANMRSVT